MRTRPVGLVHASANLTASALYAASLAARRRGVPGRARLLSLGQAVTCPCHGSRFSLRDGSIERGPATARQPVFETRESDGRIEVRLPAAHG